MATAPKATAPTIVGEIIAVPADQIDFGERLRELDREWVHALGHIMLVEGQNIPIEICRLPGRRRYTLVAGAHRLAAFQTYLDLGDIHARVVSADAAERELREISENLWHPGLKPVDRAAFVAKMHDLLRAKAGITGQASPQVIAANARWQKALKAAADDASDTMSHAYGFTTEMAERAGLTKKSIERDLMLHRRLKRSAILRIPASHPIMGNATQLRALAKLEFGEQGQVADLIADGHAKSVAEALGILGQKARKPEPEDKRLSAFIGSFGRMSLAEKKGALSQLVGALSESLADHLLAELRKDMMQ
jgi:ParB family chromosome partitioning protein